MPHKPLKPCAYPGCPNLTDGTYCEKHRNSEARKYNRYQRSSDHAKRYGSHWKKIRDLYASLHPLCERCLKEGRTTPMDEVHHIVPVSRGGTDDFSNLMSVCKSCHNKIHIEMGDRHPHE